jgi:protein-S-isoprenylcysteine O-methyltransferase Ste14
MALVNEFEKQGNFLFKYRGQFPVLLFILAIPFVYLTEQMFLSAEYKELMFYVACGLSVLGFLIRAYTIGTTPRGTSGRNTKEQVAEVLNSTGIYSLLRHPLYLGNYFMWIGIVVYSFSIYFVVIVSLLYWIYYERIMYAEERFLERKFGDKYLNWASSLPAFIPRFSNFKKSNITFSLKSVLRREYSGVLATVIGFVFMDVCRNFFNQQESLISSNSILVLLSTAAISLLLRTLKRKTNVLKEEGRS